MCIILPTIIITAIVYMLKWEGLNIKQLLQVSGTPNSLGTVHRTQCGTKPYAFLRSMKVIKSFILFSKDFFTSCRTVKVIYMQLLPFLNPHCDSGNSSSASSCTSSCKDPGYIQQRYSSLVVYLQLHPLLDLSSDPQLLLSHISA